MTSPATQLRARQILFSGAMVRAILDGSKTQTRRALNVQPLDVLPGKGEQRGRVWYSLTQRDPNRGGVFACRYGVPGDRLWVREAWQFADWTEDGQPFVRYAADGAVRFHEGAGEGEALVDTWAALSAPENYAIDGKAADRRWRPSIHMPRWACRIVLELTDVRVERLQSISESDCAAEGCPASFMGHGYPVFRTEGRTKYRNLWDSLNGARDGGCYAWDASPWVWVLTFRRVEGA